LKLKEKNLNFQSLISNLRSPVSFWIDSSGGPSHLCNLSMLGSNPRYVICGFINEVYIEEWGKGRRGEGEKKEINCFDFLEEKVKKEKDGIFVGYISYDLFQRGSKKDARYPDFFFAYFDRVITSKAKQSSNESRHKIASSGLRPPRNDMHSNMTDSEYLKKVNQIKEEIKAGNVYQVNLTREYSIEYKDINDLDLYLRLRETSPNPYGCFFRTPFVTILSSSPEEFLFIKDDYIRTRPIKGTLLKNNFEIDPKNQAENIMIVDLERNDLGRICKTGSIKANRLLEVESYKHLNHVVSTVEGELKDDVSLREIFKAVFPGGSITGAPKIAAMKLIDKIEPTKRGAYTGCFGYIKPDGIMNFNILIRTIFIENNKITFNVGGGIVADSDLAAELEEIKLKSKGIMSAIGLKDT